MLDQTDIGAPADSELLLVSSSLASPLVDDDRVHLSLTQLVGLRLAIPQRYWSCLEEVLRRVTFERMLGIRGKHYVQISYDT